MTAAPRQAEIAHNLAVVEDRIQSACTSAGRDRSEITLVVVTKTFPPEDVRYLYDLGVRDVGENRDQDASDKVRSCSDMDLTGLRWHFVGQLQTNKARSVAAYAHLVHSVDRSRLVSSLDNAAAGKGGSLNCLVQVDLDDDPHPAGATRGGVRPEQALSLAAEVAAAANLELCGVMAVAPRLGGANEAFRRLASIAAEVRAAHPQAVIVSAGMSGDLEIAVQCGATHLRVGTAILGSRPNLG